jgi:hypothetical protein
VADAEAEGATPADAKAADEFPADAGQAVDVLPVPEAQAEDATLADVESAPAASPLAAQVARAWPAGSRADVTSGELLEDDCSQDEFPDIVAAVADLMDSRMVDAARCDYFPAVEDFQDYWQERLNAAFRRGSPENSAALDHSDAELRCDFRDRSVAQMAGLDEALYHDFQDRDFQDRLAGCLGAERVHDFPDCWFVPLKARDLALRHDFQVHWADRLVFLGVVRLRYSVRRGLHHCSPDHAALDHHGPHVVEAAPASAVQREPYAPAREQQDGRRPGDYPRDD